MTEQGDASPKKDHIDRKIREIEQKGSVDLAKSATSVADDASRRGEKAIALMFDKLSAMIRKRGQTPIEPSDN